MDQRGEKNDDKTKKKKNESKQTRKVY